MQRTFSSGRVTIVDLENKFRVTHFLFKNYNSQAALPFADVIASQMKLLLYQGHVVKSLPKWLRLHILWRSHCNELWNWIVHSNWISYAKQCAICRLSQTKSALLKFQVLDCYDHFGPIWRGNVGNAQKKHFFVPLENGCWKAEMINCLCARCTFILPWYYAMLLSKLCCCICVFFNEQLYIIQ